MYLVLLMYFMCGCCVVIILLLYVCLSVCYNDCETLNCYLYVNFIECFPCIFIRM
jgi:hypothetical protein